jgi:hypothetical protein
MKTTCSTKSDKSVDAVSDTSRSQDVGPKRIFGSAKGQIIFKKGWDAPMTKRELDDFLRES